MELLREKATIMDRRAVDRALLRIAHEIIERNRDMESVALIGIHRRGVPLAEGSLNLSSDANVTGVWAVESMRHAVGMGWLDGDGGRLLPGGVATRAQLAVILQRLTTQAMG